MTDIVKATISIPKRPQFYESGQAILNSDAANSDNKLIKIYLIEAHFLIVT